MKPSYLLLPVLLSLFASAGLGYGAIVDLRDRGIVYTPEEISIWQARAGLQPGESEYRRRGDVSPHSPGDWSRIEAYAQDFIMRPHLDRYTTFHRGPGCIRTQQKDNVSFADIDAEQPLLVGDKIGAAGFFYLLTGTQLAAKKVRDELLWAASQAALDASDRALFCTDPAESTGDFNNFFLAEWYHKLLLAYDYTRRSAIWAEAEHATMRAWFLAAAHYFREMYDRDFAMLFAGRLEDDYFFPPGVDDLCGWPLEEGGWYHADRRLFDEAPRVHNLSRRYNNRRSSQLCFMFVCGVFYGDEALIESGFRFFREYFAFGVIPHEDELFVADMYRGSEGSPETGYTYSVTSIHHLVQMADVWARHHDNRMYDYVFDEAEKNVFLPDSLKDRAWYADLAVTGKSLRQLVRTTMKFVARRLPQARFGDHRIDGMMVARGSDVLIQHGMDIWMAQANRYYRDPFVRAVYTRQEPLTPAYFPPYPTPIEEGRWEGKTYRRHHQQGPGKYWNNPWGGLNLKFPGMLFLFGGLEGAAWPYRHEPGRTDRVP